MYLQVLMATEREENCLHMERQKATVESAGRPERQRLMSLTVCFTPGREGEDTEGRKLGPVHKKQQGVRIGSAETAV